jgi:hypothetical protein
MKFFKDILSLFVGMLIWIATPYLVRLFDNTAGADDPGIIQALIFKSVIILTGHFFTKVFMRLFWPSLDYYLATFFNKEFQFKTITRECLTKLILSSFFYLAVMLCWVIAAV